MFSRRYWPIFGFIVVCNLILLALTFALPAMAHAANEGERSETAVADPTTQTLAASALMTQTAVYVSTGGNNGNAGTQDFPMLTISAALLQAQSLGISQIYVQTGAYNEALDLIGGINIQGGFDNSWVFGGYLENDHMVTINGVTTVGNQHITIRAVDIVTPTTLSDLILMPPTPAPGGYPAANSYAVHAYDSQDIILERVKIVAGAAGSGTDGTPGTDASSTPAQNGGNGAGANAVSGCDDSSYGNSGSGGGSGDAKGGNGGRGGTADTDCSSFFDDTDSQPGLPGSNAAINTSTYGKGGVRGVANCGTPGNGQNGRPPVHGDGGQASLPGMLSGPYWTTVFKGAPGTYGLDGTGGGGGGGSGGCDTGTDHYGAGGGGGGAGGAKAPDVGGGGSVGGSSFGVFAVNSSLHIANSQIVRGSGGDGGDGGVGGQGQPGGAKGFGGNASGNAKAGGNGGIGGNGGNSGGGGGGRGGDAYGIFASNANVSVNQVAITGGTAGAGGNGGVSPSVPAANGLNAPDGQVLIGETSIINLVVSNSGPASVGATVHFTATAIGSPITYTWNFGDGQQGIGMQITHTYASGDAFTAVLTASNSISSVTSSTVVNIIAAPVPPTVTISRNNNDIQLDWIDHPANGNGVEVWRDTAFYFTPAATCGLNCVALINSTTYTDAGVVDSLTNYVYLVLGVNGLDSRSGASNRVGKFTFTVAP